MDKFEANIEEYNILSIIGRSSTGMADVHLAVHKPSDSYVALKKYNLDFLDRENADLIKEELILMKQLSHPCLMPSLSSFVSDNSVFCVLPLMSYGSTTDLIARYFPAGLPETVISSLLKPVLQALTYLHSKGIIHRSVRGSHIMISAEGHVKLGGLRYSCGLVSAEKWNRKVHSFPPTTLPNLNWLSPELLQQNMEGYNEKSDVYSVGITGCELANGIVPYFGTCKTLMLTEKVKGVQPQLIDASTYISDEHEEGEYERREEEEELSQVVSNRKFSEPFHRFIEISLEKDPNARPSAKQLLNEHFFKNTFINRNLIQVINNFINSYEQITNNSQKDEENFSGTSQMVGNIYSDQVNWDF